MKKKFEFLEHTADVKIRAQGSSLEQAFANSALALKEVMAEGIKVKQKIKKEITMEEQDNEALLYAFIDNFLYLLDAENFLLNKIKTIKITKEKDKIMLNAMAIGDKASNYKFTNKVKAMTYNEMSISRQKDKFIITFVVDV